MRMWKAIIGALLHVANSSPPVIGRRQFYDLKTSLLHRYGRLVTNEWQHIVKECWDCEKGCRKCNRYGKGGGIWDEFWVWLELWELGGHSFHIPRQRTYSDPGAARQIEGYIRHKSFKYYLPKECAMWLFLLYDRKTFRDVFGNSGACGRRFTPMVVIGTAIFNWRMKDGVPRRLARRARTLIDRLRPSGLTVLKLEPPDEDIPF